jgi:outer membrane protein OmpA-like peptidoglycan-associated protein
VPSAVPPTDLAPGRRRLRRLPAALIAAALVGTPLVALTAAPALATYATVPDQPGVTMTRSWYTLQANVTAPGNDGGSAITDYAINVTGPHYNQTITLSGPYPATFRNLTASTSYSVQVHAINGIGNSANRTVATSTTALPGPLPIAGTDQLIAGESAMLSSGGLFAPNTYALTSAGAAQLDTLAANLERATSIRCEGYTDPGKDHVHNFWLGLARAKAVCDGLTARNVNATTSLISYGDSRAFTTGPLRAINRRVVVFVATAYIGCVVRTGNTQGSRTPHC